MLKSNEIVDKRMIEMYQMRKAKELQETYRNEQVIKLHAHEAIIPLTSLSQHE